MIVRHFLLWVRSAAPGDRAEAVAALARAFLHSDLSDEDRWEAETALVAMLDDPSLLVRHAMAGVLAASPRTPRTIAVALAADAGEVAAPVLRFSPVLLDCDLVDAAALGDVRAQAAIASRAVVGVSLAAALAEVAGPEALVALARNPGAAIGDASFARMIERHGRDGALREALLARPDLPLDSAQAVAAAVADELRRFVVGCGWLSAERSERVAREARERTAVALSAGGGGDDLSRLVAHLRRSGQLTSALILRAILSGQAGLAEAAFADLAGRPLRQVEAAFRDRRGGTFRALYVRAGLPDGLWPAFEAAVAAWRGAGGSGRPAHAALPRAALSRRMVDAVLAACTTLPGAEAERVTALLRRFESEAAREEARRLAGPMGDDAALAIMRRHDPDFGRDGQAAAA